ncbi:reverse transcriptase domain-containing protein [Tanacetum coccineum]|uniref:Reverse transcriptase domain-containing protein n=1 Tax=Tanacetum coccineum TaxID=301880 RepID=A0ABQ5CP31_9ASTR
MMLGFMLNYSYQPTIHVQVLYQAIPFSNPRNEANGILQLVVRLFQYNGPPIPPPRGWWKRKVKVTKKEYSQEVLGFSDSVAYNNPPPYFDLIVTTLSPTLTPFDESDFLHFEEADAFIAIDDEPDLQKEKNFPEVELKELPPHLEYAFLEENNKLPVIISKDLSQEEKTSLINVTIKHSNKQLLGIKISREKEFASTLDKAKIDVISKLPHPTTVKGIRKADRRASILIAPNWDQPFEIMCDASDYAIGAVLGQRIEKHFRPIHYASKTMTEAETNYTTTEKEMLAVVYAFEKFRSYLIMNKSVVYTDHSALKYLFNKKETQPKQELLRWVLIFRIYDFKVLSIPKELKIICVCIPVITFSILKTTYENVFDSKDITSGLFLREFSVLTYKDQVPRGEKSKKLHDSKIKNRIFNVGDQVYFSTPIIDFLRKLKSRLVSVLFTITEVYPYGTAKLSHADGSNFKVNCHRLKHYYGGDTPPLVIQDLQTFPKDN